MARADRAPRQAASRRSPRLDQTRAAHQKKKPYKIVLEAVTQEKKKLHSILTYASNAPAGFGFIPAGHPDFTEWCKEQCRQRNLDVHIVSAKPKNKMHADPEKLSHHVHRVGHHFPLQIIQLACRKFAYTYDDANGLKKAKTRGGTNWIAQSMEDYSSRQALQGGPSGAEETKQYIHGAVREMFPKIPDADLVAIVNHAFKKGTDRVGNAKELPLARRVQLAVVAHIRHGYTDYDKLLKSGGWLEARSKVEHVSLAKLKEWRDEADGSTDELEDTFREVIVLDDDDEDDDDEMTSDGDLMLTPDDREQSMEIVSSRATARDLQPEQYVEQPHLDLRELRRAPRRIIVVPRYAPPPPPSSPLGSSHRQADARQARSLNAQYSISRPSSRGEILPQTAFPRPVEVRTAPAALMKGADGRFYQLEPIQEPHYQPRLDDHRQVRVASNRLQEPYTHCPPPPPQNDYHRPIQSRRTSEQDVVLPSVEPDTVGLASPRRAASDLRLSATGFTEMQMHKRGASSFLSNDHDMHSPHSLKRVRPVHRAEDIDLPVPTGPHGPGQRETYRQAQSSQAVIDLTVSPYRPHPARDRRDFASAYARPIDQTYGDGYVPLREERGAYYGTPVGASANGFISRRPAKLECSICAFPSTSTFELEEHMAKAHGRSHTRAKLELVPARDLQKRSGIEAASPRHTRSGVTYSHFR